jgi:uncharacterized protein YlbG (UPF0298 family)
MWNEINFGFVGNFKIIIYTSQHLKFLNYVNWIAQKAIDRMLERLPTLNFIKLCSKPHNKGKYWQVDEKVKCQAVF